MRTEPAVPSSEHHLQLFDSSKSLAETVSAFLMAGFERGENVLIVATPEHRELLTRRLEEAGVNIREADRRQPAGDARRRADPRQVHAPGHARSRSRSTKSSARWSRRMSNGRRVCIYGEMVDVLAARGNYKAAHQLEELWNVLGRRECYTLFCGYASGHFGDPKTAEGARRHLRVAQPSAPQDRRSARGVPARSADGQDRAPVRCLADVRSS